MSERYDSATAKHYAAYRPPLHRLILERVIGSSESFRSGLDFGCGAGDSALALAAFCDRVCGLDVSPEMLDCAVPHPKITYTQGSAESLGGLPNRPFDIVTFAGSLYYAKSDVLRRALGSVCGLGALVVVYDFNVRVDDLMKVAGFASSPQASDYDHDIGLPEWTEFELLAAETECIRVELSIAEAAYFLLSDSRRYDVIRQDCQVENVFEDLVSRLGNEEDVIHLGADIWSKSYRFNQKGRPIQ